MAEKFEVLNDREHTLLRAHLMMGSMVKEPYQMYIDGKLSTLDIVPAVLTLIREIIDNSVDEHCRSNHTAATKIDIHLTPTTLTVEDNGRGIPIEKYTLEDGTQELRPVLCWTRLRSGTSFHDHNTGPSANGVGSSVANILSNFFAGETYDGTRYCKVVCQNNMSDIDSYTKFARGHKTGTKVIIEPDFSRFEGISCFTPDHISATKERLLALAAIYPTILFTFNDEKLKFKKPIDYLSTYKKPTVSYSDTNYVMGIMPTETDEYYQIVYCEGLHIKNGGSIEAYLSREISYTLRELIKKKHKLDLSPNEIKRGLMIVFDCCNFPNMKFDSQTKEKLVNSEAEVKEYLGNINFDKICKQIMDVKEIVEPIIEAKLAKLIAAEKRATTLAQNKMKNQYVENHIPAKSKNPDDKILFLTEGLSATGMFQRVRDIQTQGCFPLRGKVKNICGLSEKEVLENKELNNIMAILGLKFGMTSKDFASELRYGKIGILADPDFDGNHIFTLLINFFATFWIDLFKEHRVFIMETPLYILTKNYGKKNEESKYIYTRDEYEQAVKSGLTKKYPAVRYIKGLGTLSANEYKYAINNQSHYNYVDIDDPNCLKIMFDGDYVQERRKIMEV